MTTNYKLYQKVCLEISRMVTKKYSTSFSRSIMFLTPDIRENIYNIYGFVRFADEIVDTFHEHDRRKLLDRFVADYHLALNEGISMNPVLNAFCNTQKTCKIPQDLVDTFVESMYMDLGEMKNLNSQAYKKYIYGSAEVVGLMCLNVFLKGNEADYNKLKPYAQSFGAALQKVNFLRDISSDFHQLNRTYFPNVDFTQFTLEDKMQIEEDIKKDFQEAIKGIKKLPLSSRFAVYLAYLYYSNLFNKIKKTDSEQLFKKRIRVNNFEKALLFSKIYMHKRLNIEI
ncbi:phytoene/squalene synthase family protein [Galbibacter pacificus]|uniref:Phytoene/squalene synthase family protein n=1 Tax=Galbibacter pacificus TaxID=2996052 RepID=A0ABT6FMD7_9FLAO|nr:phytoene/squalene synthase family protein [Galbibacter pacificus]MDG3580950.1 phytoene/squalene synthase family protein [Galbibacter pacificus]MDG3584428.1 phytoene/squalene synthase family protein [Galbibacter pacificus]